ncbi:MAG TPA: GyrI-like domain-containing protein [Spirochaetia bacterium]|nr:GyrI-like domain-containing protein [Spirochaetia bacterium]
MKKRVIDLKKKLKPFYTASATRPAIIELPPFDCLMVDGRGDPNGQDFREAVGSLYSVAYTLKFRMKKERSIDYPVMPLQGLWSADDMTDFLKGNRDRWKWTLFVVLPDGVTKKDVAAAVEEAKKKAKVPDFPEVRFEKFAEGKAAQIMHIGPYAAERPTIERLHQFVQEQGYRLRGRHHEIYLGDPRRSAPEKLKTIIRHPVERASRTRS